MSSKSEGKRRPNWSEDEKISLVDEVNKRQDRLFAKFKGCGSVKGSKLKEQAWSEIVEALNMKSSLVKRTVDECKKQYANIKQRAKDKADAIRRPKTGGGPKPPSPSLPEAKILEELTDRPTLQGLLDGFDSEDFSAVINTDMEEPGCSFASTSIQSTGCPLPLEVSIDSQGILQLPLVQDTRSNPKTTKRKFHEEEVSVLKVEREKFLVEIEKLKNEAKYFQVKVDVEQLKKEKLQQELNLLKCRNEQ